MTNHEIRIQRKGGALGIVLVCWRLRFLARVAAARVNWSARASRWRNSTPSRNSIRPSWTPASRSWFWFTRRAVPRAPRWSGCCPTWRRSITGGRCSSSTRWRRLGHRQERRASRQVQPVRLATVILFFDEVEKKRWLTNDFRLTSFERAWTKSSPSAEKRRGG